MSKLYAPFILFLLIVLQGVTQSFIPASAIEAGWIIVSHSVFSFLILFKLFYDLENTYYSLIWALVAGLMIDIVYTDIIGVYMFTYVVMIYFVHGMRKWLQANFYVSILLAIVSLGLVDFILYFIYQLIDIAHMELAEYVSFRLLPTLGVNSILFLIFYLLFRNALMRWSIDRFDVKQSTT